MFSIETGYHAIKPHYLKNSFPNIVTPTPDARFQTSVAV